LVAKASVTVLYVEDEESDRLLMGLAFAKEGLEWALRTVNDGKTAQDYLSGKEAYADREKHPLPAVVLLDLNLPEVQGFDVLKWIREHPEHSKLPVVVFTSSEREEDRERARLLGATDFGQKPGSPARFQDVAKRLNEGWLGTSCAQSTGR
jgi:CheY-like chemotaxis protein